MEPYVDGYFHVRAVDLYKHPLAAAPTQSDDTPSTPTTTSKHGARDTRRKPGKKIRHDWDDVVAEVKRIRGSGKGSRVLGFS